MWPTFTRLPIAKPIIIHGAPPVFMNYLERNLRKGSKRIGN